MIVQSRLLYTTAALAVLLGAWGCTPLSSKPVTNPAFYTTTQSPCIVPLPQDEIEGKTIVCGTVNVPENYDKPNANQIPLSYALLKATGNLPVSDPVIFLHGGPGAGELISLPQFTEDFATIRKSRDVLVFDQRGAGFSNTPLDCSFALIAREKEINAAVIQASAENVNLAKHAKILEICIENAKQRGTDLSQYNTINNARDVQSLVAAFGYKQFNLYAHSYGTKLALEIMRQEPAGLRSVILDSAAPPSVKMYERSSEPKVQSAQALFESCEDDAACDAAYPDLTLRFNRLMENLDDTPLVLEEGQEITSSTVVNIFNMRNTHYGSSGISAYLPRMIAELEQGVTDTCTGLNDDSLPPSSATDEESSLDEEMALQDLTPAQAFIMKANMSESLQTDPEVRGAYYSLPQKGATQAALLEFIKKYIPGKDREVLVEAAMSMNDEAVAELYGVIKKFLTFEPNASLAGILFPLHLFVCNESIPYNTMAGAKAYIQSAPIPAMTERALDYASESIEICDGMPTGRVDDSFHDPVVSPIPTLVMIGLNDTQTASDWGRFALEPLSNGSLAVFPESGHGVYQFSQCAKDVGAAFFKQPEGQPDMSCAQELKPKFILPYRTGQDR